MSDEIENLKANVLEHVTNICQNRIEKLVSLWKVTFESDICIDHMSRLHEHVEIFFDEVEEESRNRQIAIRTDINEWLDEGEQLKNLLHSDIVLQSHPDVPLYTAKKELQEKVQDLRAELEKRVQKIDGYLNEQRCLCDDTGETFRPLPKEPLPTDSEMKEFRAYLDRLHELKAERMEYIVATQNDIQTYYSLMEILPETDEQNILVYGEVKPTQMNVSRIKLLSNKVKSQFEDFKADMDSMRVKLAKLWEFLQVPRAEQARFDRYSEYKAANHLKLYEELQRCETIKRENMQAYIDKLRKDILTFWDMCYKSQEERQRFVHFNTDLYTEDQLELHEMELTDLRNFYTENEEIFNAYESRLELWEKMKELDAKATDPGRFANRGGQLLKEEKERKALNSRLPKIEDRLKEMCRQYEEVHKKPFTINGRTVEEIITEDHERRNEEKQACRRHPQSASNTPMHSSRMISMRTPQTASGVKNTTNRGLISSATRSNNTRMLPPSSQKSTMSGVKRRASPNHNNPAAKRNLLDQMNVSKSKPGTSRKGFVPPPVRRHSLKRQSIKKRKLSMNRRRRENIPPARTETDSSRCDSINYDVFEDLVNSKAIRSSMQPKSPHTPRTPAIKISAATPTTPGSSRKPLTANRNFQMMI